MDKGIRISIIIPAYNVEEYISECLDSVVQQQMDEIEIICINDGSTDNTGSIIRKYKENEPRIILIDQQHHGVSYSRNIGKKTAKGKYLLHLDADDKLADNALDVLYIKTEKDGLDVCCFSAEPFYENEKMGKFYKEFHDYYLRDNEYNNIERGDKMYQLLVKNGDYLSSACLYLTKRTFLIDNDISFYDGIIHEDNLYTFLVFMYAERVGFINRPLYLRRLREESIMTSEKTFKNAYGYFVCGIQMLKYLNEHAEAIPTGIRSASKNMRKMFGHAANIYINLDKIEKRRVSELDPYERELFELLVSENAANNMKLKKK